MPPPSPRDPLWSLMGQLFRAHPWHGVPIGRNAPSIVTAYIEIVPTDTVKYEIDKVSGFLKIDRPQKYSNVCPALYGLIPQTMCAEHVAARSAERTGRTGIVGDGDPLDICVLSERSIPHGDILLRARPIGGFRMLDGEEADDKIIAVLHDDPGFGTWRDMSDCPPALIERLRHYFLTYKEVPGDAPPRVEIAEIYDCEEALHTIRLSQADYHARYGNLEDLLTEAVRG